MKLTLLSVERTERISKRTNKPFTSVSILTSEYPGKKIGGFGNKDNASWAQGQTVEVLSVTPDPTGKYLNFEMPQFKKGADNTEILALSHKIDQTQSQLRSIIDHLSGKNRLDLTSAGTPVPDFTSKTMSFEDDGLDQINPNEIPF